MSFSVRNTPSASSILSLSFVNVPFVSIRFDLYSSLHALKSPVPQMPFAFTPPITLQFIFPSEIFTSAIAPSLEVMPHEIDRPSKAGPAAVDVQIIFFDKGLYKASSQLV